VTIQQILTISSLFFPIFQLNFKFFLSFVAVRFDFFQRSSSTSIHNDQQMPSYASDMRILMENMRALNVNHRQDDLSLVNSSADKTKGHRSMIPIRHYTPSMYRSSEPSDVNTFFSYTNITRITFRFRILPIPMIDQLLLISH